MGEPRANRARLMASLRSASILRAGRTNVLPYTIWMPEIDTANAVAIPSPTSDEVVVTTPNIPGWELHLPPGTIIRDKDGQIITEITVTSIPVERPPFPLPFAARFPMYFTVQPGGSISSPTGHESFTQTSQMSCPAHESISGIMMRAKRVGTSTERGLLLRNGKQVVPDEGVAVYQLSGASFGFLKGGTAVGGGSGGATTDDGDDPVDLGTGLFVLRKTDLFLPDVMPIALTRTHRQGFETQGLRPFRHRISPSL